MKPIFWILLAAAVLLILAGCRARNDVRDDPGTSGKEDYQRIDQETAMRMMALDDGHVVVDVRRQDEYDAGHIPGAVLIPNESITDTPPEALPDKDQIILIYCRSGNRSRTAAQKLADMGYANVYEFGGINTWPGETVTAETRERGEETAVLRFSSFDGGGPEFRASAEDPSVVGWTVERDYGGADHEQQTGTPYDAVFTFTGLKPGTTVLTVVGSSPVAEPLSYRYTVRVDEDRNVELTPIRTVSRLTLFRSGSIAWPSFTVAPEDGGCVLTVDEERSGSISAEEVDALYAVIEKYDVVSWDGFSESEPGVLDGEGFWLEFALTDGTTVRASGDNAFPPHYFDAINELFDILVRAASGV